MKNFLILFVTFFGLLTFAFAPQANAQCPVQANVLIKTHTDISCFGANDGTITVDIDDVATSEPFNFELFDLGAGTIITLSVTETEVKPTRSVVYSNVPPGTYAVLFFKVGCVPNPLTIIEPPFGFVIDEPAQLSVASTVDPDCGAGTGQIDIVISGGTLPYSTIVWSGPTFIPNGTTSTAANLNAGIYTVTVTDANNCVFPQNINVPITTVADAGPPTALVCGPNTFNLSANAAGPGEFGVWSGPGGVTFSNVNDPNATVTNLTVGLNTLTWTIRDIGLVCPGNSDNITVTYSDVQINGTPDFLLDCFGDSDGAGTFTVTGGAPNFSYTIVSNTAGASITLPPPGPTTVVSFTGASIGLVTLQVQDAGGCTSQATINITQPTQVTFSSTQTNVSCFGGTNGTITVTAAGGTGPYEFSSNNGGSFTAGANPFTFTSLAAGGYNIVVRDANLCTTTATLVTITQPAAAVSFGTSQTNVSCFGGTNGTITVTAAGGTGPYEFSSNNGGSFTAGANPFTFTSLAAGGYNIVVRDANLCTTTATLVTITQPAATVAIVTNSITDNSSCVTFNGAIDITVTGATGIVTFAWTGPSGFTASTEDISGLEPGNYNITATDANGCIGTALITVGDVAPILSLTNTVTDNTNCTPFNGAINITVTGSAGPFTFDWTGPSGFTASTEDITGLEPGVYDIIVTDNASGCTVNATITVNDSSPVLSITSLITDNTRCVSPFDGAIDITIAGSVGPFTFDWIGPNGFTSSSEDIIDLESGDYDVIVTDNVSGCTVIATISVNDNIPALSIGSVITDNTRCVSIFNGAIDITMAGSTGPFTFDWTGPGGFTSSSEDITNVEAGDYNIDVTDIASGCTTSALITVGDLTVIPSVSATIVDNDQCNPPFNGAILLDITPLGAHSFSWTGPGGFTSSSEDIISLASGAYQVTVTNIVSGCSTVENITVNDNSTPVTVTADAISDNSSCTAPFNGVILITALPAGSYTYSWTGPGGFTSSSEDISALQDGDYTVTATNTTLGCSTVQLFTVGDNTVTINITSQTIADNTNCKVPFNGSISITAGGTVGPYQFDWTGPGGFTGSGASISALQSGDYDVTITDLTIGCTDIYTLTVGDATPPITLTLDATAPNTNCVAPFTGSLSITASGTAGPYAFDWVGPNSFTSTSEDIAALENGDYDITVTDTGLGCVATATFTVADARPTVTISTVSVTDNTSCVAPFNGALTISAGGTAGPFTLNWTGPSGFIGSGTSNSLLEPGDYTITATDQVLGCQAIRIITVPDLAPAILVAPVIVGNSNCLAPFNGSIDISVAGTPGPYSFSWTGPNSFASSSEDINGLEAGDYDLQVIDTNLGCTGLFTFTVPQNATTVTITLQSSTPNSNCSAPFNGALDVTIGGTPGPYTISWTGPGVFSASTEDIAALASGNYTITVTDNLLGCTVNATFNVANTASGCGGLNCFAFTVTSVEQRPSCALQDDGSITFTVSGGTPNYIVTLTDGAGFNVSLPGTGPNFAFNNLSPADYTYIILDQAGNVCPLPYSLPVQTNVIATATSFVDAVCNGQPTGQAVLTVLSGGNSPFEYSLDGIVYTTFVSGQNITNLPPNGTYPILIRDDASDLCPYSVNVTINNLNPAITATLTATAATCNNNDGSISIDVLPSGGDGGPFTYQFGLVGSEVSVSLPAGNVFNALPAGSYNFIVTDNSTCQQVFNRTVAFPGFVNTSPPVVTNPDCTGNGSNGSIFINILDVGSFEFAVSSDPAFVPTAVDFTTTGGPTVIIPNLSNGTYYVWLQSLGSQCPTRLAPIIVNGVFAVSFTGIGSDELCFGTGGSIALSNILGAPNIDYSLEVNGSVTGTIDFISSLNGFTETGLIPGPYQVRLIQDQTALNGCVVSTGFQSFTISGPTSALGFTSVATTLSFPDQPTGSIQIVVQESGEEDYEVWFVNNDFESDTLVAARNPVQFEAAFAGVAAGTYTLYVRDALGCEVEQEVVISIDPEVFIPNIFTPNNDGVNEQFYVRNLPPSGSKLSITNRWGKEVFSSGNYNPDNLWDGDGTPDGVYYYRLQIKDGDTYTGWVEILRGTKP